ncbi:ShlB/FhaC/HecB family hemolysin secretion/activation protein [Sphingobium amiense]|uniref:ShlB/FhaC/HecB family hemolysin secretion/activation protein n=1 Tax=Sphingobium amiense TaxID=135719 RepID=A0A494W4I3_9SPHN|nr:ShlB/FhaC/HecB family hemolysin secretion/activation protein [Sphingobium amiense]BBD99131.1 ShlB/FhaC/HecB family hemolysin secretion/activation protein [Sphingobium amiense]
MLLVLAALPAPAAAMPPSTLSPPLIQQGEQPAAPNIPEKANGAPLRGDVAVDADDSSAAIRGIDFVGVDAPERVAHAARQFLGRPASRQTLAALARAISDAYARSDIALYTVAIPQQDLSTGQVKVLLAEGFVEDIVYPKGASPLIRAYAERMRAEKPLSRRALERYLSLIRDIPGAKVDVALERGTKPGGVKLAITPARKRFDVSFGIDNRTQSGLGSGQLRATAQANSLLRDGDRTDLVMLGATDLRRYQYVGLSHQTPLGSDGLALGLSGSWLRTRLKNFPVTGEAKSLGLSLSYPVIRSYRRNLTVSTGLDGLDSDAALLGAVLSSDHIRAVRAAAGYSAIGDRDVLTAGLTLSRGLDILDARGTPGFADTVFTKVTARAGYDRMLGKRFVGRLRMTGQYSADRLAGNERFAVGGADYGRAFDTALLSGDRGAAGSFEFAYRPELGKPLKGTEVYGFIDGASVRINRRTGFEGRDYSLASAGGGVRLAYASKASLGLEGARVIKSPFAGVGDWRFNVSWYWKLNR